MRCRYSCKSKLRLKRTHCISHQQITKSNRSNRTNKKLRMRKDLKTIDIHSADKSSRFKNHRPKILLDNKHQTNINRNSRNKNLKPNKNKKPMRLRFKIKKSQMNLKRITVSSIWIYITKRHGKTKKLSTRQQATMGRFSAFTNQVRRKLFSQMVLRERPTQMAT